MVIHCRTLQGHIWTPRLCLPKDNIMKLNSIYIFLSCALLAFAGLSHSDSGDPQTCFEKRDKVCLDLISKELGTDPSPEQFDAIYLLGLLHLEDKEYEEAKQRFKLGAGFGDKARNVEKLDELYKSGNVEVRLDDCHATRTEECYLGVANKRPKQAKRAYYSLAAKFKDTDPERSETYLIKAAELGHKPSTCLLEISYTEFKPDERKPLVAFILDIKKDPVKAKYWGEKCPF